MTPADLDALIERIPDVERKLIILLAKLGIPAAELAEIGMLSQAAAALVQLRDSEALARGKIVEQMIELGKYKDEHLSFLARTQRAEAEVAQCENDRDRYAREANRAEAEVARLKDSLRQANGVRDVFASAVVMQTMQEVDKMPDSRVPDDDMVICPGCVHQFRAVPVNVQARIAALEAERGALRHLLAECLPTLRQWAPNSVDLIGRIDAAREKP